MNFFSSLNRANWQKPVSIAPLVGFRIAFGSLMLLSILRFWWRGWVNTVYIHPKFHFTYQGFEWVHPLSATGMHLLFFLLAISALMIALGLLYRVATIFFFLAFTYVELIDVTTYLNHYYFVSLIAFLLIWLPASRDYALDVRLRPGSRRLTVPAWTIGILRFQIALVYLFAGLAKLNPDWLIHAQPMRTWLPAKSHLPLVGDLMYETWVAYLFSWFGALYDLFIVFFLLNKRTRPVAYIFVLVFHIATAVFFPGIGMFPYVMMVCSTIFFSSTFHKKILSFFPFYGRRLSLAPTAVQAYRYRFGSAIRLVILSYACIQLLIPVRFILYPGHLFWHEEGYRFSWRVMLMEKSGATYFTVKDKAQHIALQVNNAEFLTPLQEKMMSTQPDLILKYAHYLAAQFALRGVKDPEVYAEVYVALNGQRSRLFVDSTVNLAAQPVSWHHYQWVLPYTE
jgi:hypothetical protein